MLGTYGEVNTAALGGLERCVRATALDGCRKGIKLDKWNKIERIATRYDFPWKRAMVGLGNGLPISLGGGLELTMRMVIYL